MSFLFGGGAKPTPPPPVPQPRQTSEDGAAIGAAQLAAAQAGGYQSTMKTGGLGVPSVKTSSASLLGV